MRHIGRKSSADFSRVRKNQYKCVRIAVMPFFCAAKSPYFNNAISHPVQAFGTPYAGSDHFAASPRNPRQGFKKISPGAWRLIPSCLCLCIPLGRISKSPSLSCPHFQTGAIEPERILGFETLALSADC